MTLKNGRYYAVLKYIDAGGRRKTKWILLGFPEKGDKRKAEVGLARRLTELTFSKEVSDLSGDTLDGKRMGIEQQSAKTKSGLCISPLIGGSRKYFMQVKETPAMETGLALPEGGDFGSRWREG